MNTDAQRIAIAEACGWSFVCNPAKEWDYVETPQGGQCNRLYAMNLANSGPLCVPDYLADLNAMHEAEKVLTDAQRRTYSGHLCRIIGPRGYDEWSGLYDFALLSTTAAQRAEAFLRTIGK
jgi:hypothetical protein